MFDCRLPDPAEIRVLDDAALVTAIQDAARACAATEARQLAAVAELHRRRCAEPEHPDWACDDTDAAAAELGAALNVGHRRALRLLELAVLLRDTFPKTGALFLSGAIPAATVTAISERTYLLTDPDGQAALDALLAEHAGAWGALSKYKLTQAIDFWVDKVDPAAVHRAATHARNRDFVVGEADERSGTAQVYGRLLATDAALLDQRVAAMARGVCEDDPRTLAQRRSDAAGALGAGSLHLACRCAAPDCPNATDDGRATSITIHLLADHTTTTTEGEGGGGIDGEHPGDFGRTAHTVPTPATEPDADTEPEPEPEPEAEAAAEAEAKSESAPAPTPARATSAPRPSAGLIVGTGGLIVPAPLLADLIAHGATLAPLKTPCAQAEPRYRPSKTLATFVRMRDLTCRWPGCDRPAILADIDHTIPYPDGPTHAGNTKVYCRKHHLHKTFWPGWTERQLPDGALILTAPTGHTYTTKPGSTLLFPTWNTTTPPPPPPPQGSTPAPNPGRGLMMPTRKTTRAKARQYRIKTERAHNQAYLDAHTEPPRF